jgi:hypothetical protein
MSGMDNFESFMRQMAAAEVDAVVPSGSAIWWRAELRRRLALEERAMRPVRIAEGFTCALCMIAAVLLAGQLGTLQVFIR